MRVTKVLLLVMHTASVLQSRDEPITHKRITRELGLRWDFLTYLKRMDADGLIFLTHGSRRYALTDRGKQFCAHKLKGFDTASCKTICQLYQDQYGIVRLQDVLEILMTVRNFREANEVIWPAEIARDLGRHPKGYSKSLQPLEQMGLLTKRFETEKERCRAGAPRRRYLYELGDAGKELLEAFC